MKNARLAALLAVGVVLAAGVAIGIVVDRTWLTDAESTQRHAGPPFPPLERRLAHFRERLELNDEQTETIEAVLTETREKAGVLHSQVEPQLQAIREDTQKRIREILTDEQKVKYDELVREFDERFSRRRGRFMRGGEHGPRGGGRFNRLDQNGDGKVTKEELENRDHPFARRILERFETIDKDGDSALTREELRSGRPK